MREDVSSFDERVCGGKKGKKDHGRLSSPAFMFQEYDYGIIQGLGAWR
ncbi:MAG: hypothetical protein SWQ30_03270 [Thermodesulfobacteriota bacterium]|nr:hypothetical protein [Thermodesulfobacteriota bacterium]